ncbi:MAG: undecaprenyl/decaprenyl-phosphate alpha-N-acetylglucosaminyl 1-phosphate transferase, partial [Lysinibacillus sp.]|nr:undecaprenyl/decaprenyl-phosphate alpha-N-acetylglucosaminyl 1-phosphate transferase [Lysinibacillus sp.]
MIYVSLAVALVASIILTPLVKRLAFRIGAVDAPNYRKVHQNIMPRLGGLAIFLSFLIGLAILRPESPPFEEPLMPLAIILGALVIVITG